MAGIPDEELSALSTDKALAIGSYGEAVAAYRYLILAENAPTEAGRKTFAEMADEEQDHKQRLRALLKELFPEAHFVLTDDDKDMVVVGPRQVEVHDPASFAEAMRMMLFSEKRTAGFYAKISKLVPEDELAKLFRELAEEGVEHYQRLRDLAAEDGILPNEE